MKSEEPDAVTYGGLLEDLNPLGTGGGFEYSVETLHDLAGQWRQLAQDYRDDRLDAERIAQTEGPGLEYASQGNAELIQASGQALMQSLSARANHCDAMADKFLAALGKYATTEEQHAAELEKPEGLA
ncbi:hypothetical protein OG439_40785 [Amycolatopsis sp. NBC_01307]|uniref:hypothetical protein n=1 Tax=Amycolatopsis sp. NBC_01307 TaxID=2903561 RepID=UPI002E0EB8AA|nr:hypothetical protein OG439_40785 [Amycolatopsis sp. NBC_01307]